MYGLIHQSIKDMVITARGHEAWERIKCEAHLTDEDFLTMTSYDDSTTMALVAAACSECGMATGECLDAFGQHWIAETASKTYGSLLDSYGTTLWGMLENLDYLHDRISTTFPGFNAPSFELHRDGDNSCRLVYTSSRQGLEQFVVGLIKGLAAKFGVAVDILMVDNVSDADGQCTTFRLETSVPPCSQ